ncbi:MAG TPA: hypothetical protein VFZ78_06900 [Flavisolibacter sp.]
MKLATIVDLSAGAGAACEPPPALYLLQIKDIVSLMFPVTGSGKQMSC